MRHDCDEDCCHCDDKIDIGKAIIVVGLIAAVMFGHYAGFFDSLFGPIFAAIMIYIFVID